MRFQHFLITRLGFRPVPDHPDSRFINRAATAGSSLDPLEPRRLHLRHALFEVVCAPSVRAQTDDAFTWVLVVDPALPASHRRQLADLTAGIRSVVVHDYDPARPIGGVEWLEPHLEHPLPDYLLTTNLDGDDGLPPTFVSEMRRWIGERAGGLAPIQLFGPKAVLQWDLATSKAAPLGYVADWHRARGAPVPSPGFSLLARYPDYPISGQGLNHAQSSSILDWSVQAPSWRVEQHRSELRDLAGKAGDDLQRYPASETYHVYTDWTGPALMTNHLDNVQIFRLYERKRRIPVVGSQSFPNATIDWEAFERHAPLFRSRRRHALRYRYSRLRRSWQRVRASLGPDG